MSIRKICLNFHKYYHQCNDWFEKVNDLITLSTLKKRCLLVWQFQWRFDPKGCYFISTTLGSNACGVRSINGQAIKNKWRYEIGNRNIKIQDEFFEQTSQMTKEDVIHSSIKPPICDFNLWPETNYKSLW